jgi:DpnII restriction endonuclease.
MRLSRDEIKKYLCPQKGLFKETARDKDYYVEYSVVRNNLNELEKISGDISIQRKEALNTKICYQLLDGIPKESDEKIWKSIEKIIDIHFSVIEIFPLLIAVRVWRGNNRNFNLITDLKKWKFEKIEYPTKPKEKLTKEEKEVVMTFVKKYNIASILREIRNVYDYLFGIEVGMGTNGRKNRSGMINERFVEYYISEIVVEKSEWKYISQATMKKIRDQWNIGIDFGSANKRIDFILCNEKERKLIFIETNFFATKGSKPDIIGDGYSNQAKKYKAKIEDWKVVFILVTDGLNWKSGSANLKEVALGLIETDPKHLQIDYILTYTMLEDDYLQKILDYKY